MGKFIDLTGQKFSRLTVLERAENKSKHTRWLCLCECGNQAIVHAYDLTKGHTQSCGCYQRDRATETKTIHGEAGTRLHVMLNNIRQRCLNPNNHRYADYGLRGITVCLEWQNNFQSFYKWAMENGYQNDLTIERKDVNGNYEPSNCTFATLKEQANNKRNNHMIEYQGKKQTLSQWCDELNLTYSTVHARINQLGWTVERAFKRNNREVNT